MGTTNGASAGASIFSGDRRAVREMLRADDQRHILHDPMLTVNLFC